MSSYAGMLFSLDDFYSLSSGLTTLETTLFVYNITLFDLVTPVGTMWEPVRVMTANRLATNERWNRDLVLGMMGVPWETIFGRRSAHIAVEISEDVDDVKDGNENNRIPDNDDENGEEEV